MATGRPVLRSVDSEGVGRVMEPRKNVCHGSRRRTQRGRQHRSAEAAECRGPVGVEEQGTQPGVPQALGILPSPWKRRIGGPAENPQALGWCAPARGEQTRCARAVPVSGGNEVSRDGRQEVEVPNSTEEARELSRRNPSREVGAGSLNRWRERWRRHRAPVPSQRNCNG